MRALALLAIVSLTASAQGRFDRFCSRGAQGGSDRGFLCDDGAFFEAFPASGAGTTTACSTTAPTGAKGEVLTFTRASPATCTKTAGGGLATTGIANGDLVSLSANVARVEYDSASTLGLLVEGQGINLLPRFSDLTNPAWSDVGTPNAVSGATDPFNGTTGVTFTDNDGVAFEGKSQPVTVVAASAQVGYCYVKAGTLDKATVRLDGTVGSITGLSSTTWSIVQVADASASGVSILFEILAGSAVGDQGTVIIGGCDVKAGTYITSIVPTVAASATRVVEVPYFAITAPAGSQSIAATRTGPAATLAGARIFALTQTAGTVNYSFGVYHNTLTNFALAGTIPSTVTGGTQVSPSRLWASWDGTTLTLNADGSPFTSTPGAISVPSRNSISLGVDSSAGISVTDGIISRVCLDPSPTRCR